MADYDIIKRDEIYNGSIVRVVVDDVLMPNGKTAKREIVLHHRQGVGILAVDDNGDIYLVRQYRHPLGQHVLEIPAGIINNGESHAQTAARELEEEIGYKPKSLSFAIAAHNTIGVCNDKIYIYIAKGLIKSEQKLDEDEFLTVEKYSLKECDKMIASGEIIDSKTILAIFAYKLLHKE